MPDAVWNLDRDGFCILHQAVQADSIHQLLVTFAGAFADESQSVRARSSQGHVYAARNLIGSIPLVTSVWQVDPLITLLRDHLGDGLGLVRALFFDKPPERTWNLPWHKDTSIAVADHSAKSAKFSRPTIKAGVPHVIACDEILRQMLTLRIHLDEVTDENGPLRVIPGSHLASDCTGAGFGTAVTIYACAGDVLAMRPLISHASGSSIEGTLRHRRILHLEFSATEFLPDGFRWHEFIPPSWQGNKIASNSPRP